MKLTRRNSLFRNIRTNYIRKRNEKFKKRHQTLQPSPCPSNFDSLQNTENQPIRSTSPPQRLTIQLPKQAYIFPSSPSKDNQTILKFLYSMPSAQLIRTQTRPNSCEKPTRPGSCIALKSHCINLRQQSAGPKGFLIRGRCNPRVYLLRPCENTFMDRPRSEIEIIRSNSALKDRRIDEASYRGGIVQCNCFVIIRCVFNYLGIVHRIKRQFCVLAGRI